MNTKVTNDQCIAALLEAHGQMTLAASNLGITYQALRDRTIKHARVRAALLQARENRVDRAEKVIDNLLDTDHFGAAKFTLRTQGKHRGWADEGPSPVTVTFTVERIDEPRDEQGNILELPGEVE
jgi:hypothetical protein